VVGRLASRYGIKVQLRHSWYDGVAALVLLPAVLLTAAGERPAVAPPISAGGAVSPDPLLPIFEAARSDWFDEGEVHRDHLPLRRHATPAPTHAEDTGAAAKAGEPVE
jgi:hypothetical protein